MTTKDEAERLADDLDTESAGNRVSNYNARKAAALLRSQAAEIERKDALLRDALEVLDAGVCDFWSAYDEKAIAVIDRLKTELGEV